MSAEFRAPSFLMRHPFWFYVRQNPRGLAVGIGFLIVTDLLDGLWPLIIKEGIDRISQGVQMSDVSRTALLFFAVMASLSITRFGWRMGFGRFHTLAAEDLRLRAFAWMSRLTPSFFLKNPVGELMSLLTNDVQAFRQAIGGGLLTLLDGIIILVVILPIMFRLNAGWTVQALVFLPVVPWVIWWVTKKIHGAYKHQQKVFAQLTAHSQESVAGIRVVKGFALEHLRLQSFNQESRAFEDACNRTARIDALYHPVMEMGVTIGTVIFLFVVRHDLVSGAATVGSFVAFHRYILKTIWPVTALGLGLSQMQKGFASFERIRQMLQTEPELRTAGARIATEFESLEFRNVGFRYQTDSPWIFRGLSFHLRKGQSLGILGPVGAGKSTLAALLTRQFDPTEGEIYLNGHPLESYTLESVRGTLVLVAQDVFLFSESVLENLGFSQESGITPHAAETAAREVDIHDEISRWPQAYQSLVGEKGVNLSGGQKQRMSLARGLLAEAPVLILDDVLSAVDTKTEKRIESALQRRRDQGQTQIVVAHRLSTIRQCDQFVVLNDQRMEIAGDTQALGRSAFYQNLQRIQEGGGVVEN